MAVKSVQATVERWKNAAAAGQQAFTDGVQTTTIDVASRAIAAKASLLANFTEAVVSGRWERGITGSGGTANWKAKTLAKASNYSTGINAAEQKFASAMAKLLPAIESIVASLPPKQAGNMAASKARVNAFIDAMHAQKGNFKG